jgi:protein-disulfide isomerase
LVSVVVVCALLAVVLTRDLIVGIQTASTSATVVPPRRDQVVQPPVRPDPPIPLEPIEIADASRRGRSDAPVAVIEHTDYECPFCGRFARETAKALDEAYVDTGKVQWVLRHLPLESMHPRAFRAAEAAECAGRQGKGWEMHRSLFETPSLLAEPELVNRAKALDLNVATFGGCLAGQASAKVRADIAAAASAFVTVTPTFLIGKVQADGRVKVVRRVTGAKPLSEFQAAIDAVFGQ